MKITKKLTTVGSSLGIILDKVFLDKYNLKKGDKLDINITGIKRDVDFSKKIAIKCPVCENIFITNENADVADCPNCNREIKNVNFDIVDENTYTSERRFI